MPDAPRDREFYALIRVPVRWAPYKPSSQQFKGGIHGRWQKMNEYGGWDNLQPNKPPTDWEDIPSGETPEGSNLDVY